MLQEQKKSIFHLTMINDGEYRKTTPLICWCQFGKLLQIFFGEQFSNFYKNIICLYPLSQ